MIPVFDSNILIDHLNGYEPASTEVLRYAGPLVSIVTWVEVMVGIKTPAMQRHAEDTFAYFKIIEVNAAVASVAVHIRKQHRIALPDALIWATAKIHNTLLITRNTRDFPENEPDIRVPYQL